MTMASPWRGFGLFSVFSLLLLALVPIVSASIGTSMDFGALAERASEQTGIEWTSNLLDVVRLALAEPGLWLLILGSSVPSLAALATLACGRDRAAWRDWLSRLSPVGPEPVRGGAARALPLTALVVAGIVLAQLAVFALREWLTPGRYARDPSLFGAGLLTAILSAALLDQGAVLEEAGWRGYATPLLQRGGVSPLRAAIAVGVAWGLWHVPRDVVTGVIDRLGALEYAFLFLPAFALGTITTSIIASFLMNRLGGSVWPAIVVHGLVNDAMGFAGSATIEQALTPYHQITKAAPLVAVALLLVASSRGRLGFGGGGEGGVSPSTGRAPDRTR